MFYSIEKKKMQKHNTANLIWNYVLLLLKIKKCVITIRQIVLHAKRKEKLLTREMILTQF